MSGSQSRVLRTTIPVGPLQCNCTILVDEETRDAVLIDPGDEPARILAAIERAGARPVALLHTHAHFDHIGASSAVAEKTGALIRLHAADRFLWDALPAQAEMFGLKAQTPRTPDAALENGETIAFGSSRLRAIHTPGHTPGSTCFLLESDGAVLYSGDTLFRRSIGRTDLWGGDSDQILDSIRERLFTLPNETPVVCGHGPDTTIGEEKRQNPFVGLEGSGEP
jgi:hydroxyacylglutathione hydrolase